MGNSAFIDRLSIILNTLAETEDENLNKAAQLMATSLAKDDLVHLFGSGHSVIPVMDAFPRYGSFVGLNPLTDPRLMWSNVLGPGGVRELLWLERSEGYIAKFLGNQPLRKGDTILIFSHGGRNAAPTEAAMYARENELSVVGVTSLANMTRPAEHSSGKRLVDFCDVVIDTGVPVEDALCSLEGWDRPVAGASTIMACVVVGELLVRTASKLQTRGIVFPTFVSPTVPGAQVQSNDEVFEAYRQRILKAAQRKD